ncbi:MAG TPA: type IV pilus assembly protein PilM [Verrucomicrobiae bacterium]|nr:type IV pilus assembly protein PilM [Verrucomicrobiae bacterium]
MLNSKSFLTVDFGAGSLKLAEFELNEAGGLSLKNFVIKPLGAEGAQESSREATILKALREAIAEKGFKSHNLNICAPGFQVFSKFVKLPPVDAGKVTQIIQYEAQQNVPFPLAEVVWDYQIMGSSASGELEVLLVAIKSDIVEGLFRIAEQAKLKLNLCDASPAALCNAFKYNYGELEDCTMLLDIGAKTSNLLFFEKGKVFSRSISLGANSITQDFANEAKLKFDIAEQIKVKEGFVSLGGAYEEPENANQAAISKIARQFMTKLHIQVNQTMQFYRGQQGGSAPQRLFLAGGASLMPYTAQFFAEKLNVPVEYFNPFRNVQIDPAVNLEELARVANSLGEVVGLALRNAANCPVEMNLMPESTLRWQRFNEKKPYFIATVCSLVLVAFGVGLLYEKLAKSKEDELQKVQPDVQVLTSKSERFKKAHGALLAGQKDATQIATWIQDRYYWGETLAEFRRSLITAEADVQKKLSAQKPGVQAGIWVEQLTSMSAATGTDVSGNNPVPFHGQYPGGGPFGGNPGGYPPQNNTPDNAATTNSVPAGTITVICRAVSLSNVDPSANTEIAYAVENALKSSPLFDPKGTQLSGQITPDDASGTFTFGISVALKNPLNL